MEGVVPQNSIQGSLLFSIYVKATDVTLNFILYIVYIIHYTFVCVFDAQTSLTLLSLVPKVLFVSFTIAFAFQSSVAFSTDNLD